MVLVAERFASQKLELAVLQIGIVERGENVRDTETLWNAFGLLELLLIEGDVVVASNVR